MPALAIMIKKSSSSLLCASRLARFCTPNLAPSPGNGDNKPNVSYLLSVSFSYSFIPCQVIRQDLVLAQARRVPRNLPYYPRVMSPFVFQQCTLDAAPHGQFTHWVCSLIYRYSVVHRHVQGQHSLALYPRLRIAARLSLILVVPSTLALLLVHDRRRNPYALTPFCPAAHQRGGHASTIRGLECVLWAFRGACSTWTYPVRDTGASPSPPLYILSTTPL
jgi:hypothetical protein